MMQCIIDQPLCISLKWFNHTWFFLRSGVLWIAWRQQTYMVFNDPQWPIEKTCQVIWDAMHHYSRIERKHNMKDLAKALDVAYQEIKNKFDSTWGVKGLIVTQSNLVVM